MELCPRATLIDGVRIDSAGGESGYLRELERPRCHGEEAPNHDPTPQGPDSQTPHGVLIERRIEQLPRHVDGDHFTQHSPELEDGTAALRAALEAGSDEGPVVCYHRLHRVLAEGSFVLSVSEGTLRGVHSAFYDLFRLSHGKLVEHWDTVEGVAPRSEWKNQNGKF